MTVYLDNAATASYTDVDDVIIDTVTDAMKRCWHNPSSLYANEIREEINKCRCNIANFINAKSNEVIFNSGASEGNNHAIRGWIDEVWLKISKTPHIISTKIEHKSILELLKNIDIDAVVRYCDVNEDGVVDFDSLERKLMLANGSPVLVVVGFANNEIGTVQPIKEISNLVHKYGGILHVDATQAFTKIPIDVEELGIDMMSISGHKISPVLKGVGFLYKKNSINIQPLIYGSQENGLRGGTENTFGIIGLAKALEFCDMSDEKIGMVCCKRDYFISRLRSEFGCMLNGHPTRRLPNNINVTFFQDVTGESILYILSMSDIYISTSSACNSHSIEPSYVLKTIGLSDEQAMKAIRITIPEYISYKTIDEIVEEIGKSLKLIETN